MFIYRNSVCVIHSTGVLILARDVSRGDVLAVLVSSSGKKLIVRAGDDGSRGEILLGPVAAIRRFLREG